MAVFAARHRTLLGPALAGVLVTCVVAFHWFSPIESFARDLLVRIVPRRPAYHVAVIAIDDASLQHSGPWPWPRERLAALVRSAAASGASAVGIDLLLPDARSGDAELAAACRTIQCVVASTFDDRREWILPSPALRRDLKPAHAVFELDDDGILRRIFTTKQDQRLSLPAFSVQLRAGVSGAAVATGRQILPGFRTPPRSIPIVSARALLAREASALAVLRGRVVIIGVTATALGDRVMTPRSRAHESDPGVLVHASSLESLQSGDTFRETSPLIAGVVAALLVWIVLRFSLEEEAVRRSATHAILLAVPGGSAVVLVFAHLLLPVVTLSSAVAAAILIVEARRALRLARHSQAALATLQSDVGSHVSSAEGGVGDRLEALALAVVRRRVGDAQSKRVLAHELKTPLSAMRNLSQLLAGFDLNSAERQRLAMLLSDEAERLQEMITRLLEIEQLATHALSGPAPTIDLSDLVLKRTSFLARGMTRPIETEIEAGIFICGDGALIDRVIENLIGNALKYTPQGSPISVRLRREDAMTVMEVMDRGPGVPAEERERIFGTFARGTTSTGTDGLGLGLALVSQAARWHGGVADVRQRDGGGCIFRVQIPAAVGSVVAEAV